MRLLRHNLVPNTALTLLSKGRRKKKSNSCLEIPSETQTEESAL